MDDSLAREFESICVRPQMYICGSQTLAETLAFITGFMWGSNRDEDQLPGFGNFVNDRLGQPRNVVWSWSVLNQYKHLSPEEGRAALLALFQEFSLLDETKPRS